MSLLLFFPAPMPGKSSGPWNETFDMPPNFPALENVKCHILSTGRLFRHLGMQILSFQGPEEFSDMGECEKDLLVAGKMSWYQQRDCQSWVIEFSDGKLKQKGFFHSVQGFACSNYAKSSELQKVRYKN
jgi:hypothetical protein